MKGLDGFPNLFNMAVFIVSLLLTLHTSCHVVALTTNQTPGLPANPTGVTVDSGLGVSGVHTTPDVGPGTAHSQTGSRDDVLTVLPDTTSGTATPVHQPALTLTTPELTIPGGITGPTTTSDPLTPVLENSSQSENNDLTVMSNQTTPLATEELSAPSHSTPSGIDSSSVSVVKQTTPVSSHWSNLTSPLGNLDVTSPSANLTDGSTTPGGVRLPQVTLTSVLPTASSADATSPSPVALTTNTKEMNASSTISGNQTITMVTEAETATGQVNMTSVGPAAPTGDVGLGSSRSEPTSIPLTTTTTILPPGAGTTQSSTVLPSGGPASTETTAASLQTTLSASLNQTEAVSSNISTDLTTMPSSADNVTSGATSVDNVTSVVPPTPGAGGGVDVWLVVIGVSAGVLLVLLLLLIVCCVRKQKHQREKKKRYLRDDENVLDYAYHPRRPDHSAPDGHTKKHNGLVLRHSGFHDNPIPPEKEDDTIVDPTTKPAVRNYFHDGLRANESLEDSNESAEGSRPGLFEKNDVVRREKKPSFPMRALSAKSRMSMGPIMLGEVDPDTQPSTQKTYDKMYSSHSTFRK